MKEKFLETRHHIPNTNFFLGSAFHSIKGEYLFFIQHFSHFFTHTKYIGNEISWKKFVFSLLKSEWISLFSCMYFYSVHVCFASPWFILSAPFSLVLCFLCFSCHGRVPLCVEISKNEIYLFDSYVLCTKRGTRRVKRLNKE